MNDLASGAENEEQAHQMFSVSREIMEEAGFNHQKLCSNSTKFANHSILIPAKRTTLMSQNLAWFCSAMSAI